MNLKSLELSTRFNPPLENIKISNIMGHTKHMYKQHTTLYLHIDIQGNLP